MRLILVLLSYLLLATGCMPMWVEEYYSPSAEGGTATKSTCDKSVGPRDRLEIIKDDVIFGVEAYDGLTIFLHIEIPAERSVRISNTLVIVSNIRTDNKATGNIAPMIPYGGRQWNIKDELIGNTSVRKLFFGAEKIEYNEYSLQAKIPFPKSQEIKVKLPVIIINGKEHNIPEITFTKSTHVDFFMPINC